VRDLVVHPQSGLVLDFAEDDFGGSDQAAIIRAWQDRHHVEQGEFVCHLHRNRERPWLYLQQRGGLLVAAHWPGMALAGSHEIHHGISDEHKRQVAYMQRAGVAAGFEVKLEVPLATKVRPDAIIYGPQVDMGVEVQRSALSRSAAKARMTKARRAGIQPVWFSDNRSNPSWFGAVPGIRMMDMPWDTLPGQRSVKVISGVPAIIGRRCRNMRNSVCPDRPYGCNRWHPDYEPRAVLVDDLAELVPAGELVAMLFRTPSGREHVFIVSPNDKARYEAIAGRSADLPLRQREREALEQAERIACSADAGVVIELPTARPRPVPVPTYTPTTFVQPANVRPLHRDYSDLQERYAEALDEWPQNSTAFRKLDPDHRFECMACGFPTESNADLTSAVYRHHGCGGRFRQARGGP